MGAKQIRLGKWATAELIDALDYRNKVSTKVGIWREKRLMALRDQLIRHYTKKVNQYG